MLQKKPLGAELRFDTTEEELSEVKISEDYRDFGKLVMRKVSATS